MKNSKIIFGIGLFVIIALVISWNMLDGNRVVYLHTEFPAYDSQGDMVNASDLIVEGTVIGSYVKKLNIAQPIHSDDPKQNPSKDGNGSNGGGEVVYTISKVKVNKVYKGEKIKPGDVIEVKTLGGTVDDVTYKEEHSQPFANNKTYLMFLKEFENNIPYSLINPIQGSYEKKDNQYVGRNENKVKLDLQSLEKINKNKKVTSPILKGCDFFISTNS